MAVAIFTSRPNSQDFQERRIQLNEPVKIGRSVAKVKSAASNLIFDCKVLSRNHAIIWHEGGKVSPSTFLSTVLELCTVQLNRIAVGFYCIFRFGVHFGDRYHVYKLQYINMSIYCLYVLSS